MMGNFLDRQDGMTPLTGTGAWSPVFIEGGGSGKEESMVFSSWFC